jgi:hypothetical protein
MYPAREFNSHTSPTSVPQDRPSTRVFSLSPHAARRVKRYLITGYCRGKIPMAAVETYFNVFPELRGA